MMTTSTGCIELHGGGAARARMPRAFGQPLPASSGRSAELAFARSLAKAELVVEPVLDSDWGRIAELTEKSLDLPLGMVDASIVALAERHVEAFTLVP